MELKDGVPCEHPGCANHVTHPCEGCGRIGASSKLTAVLIAELEAQLAAAQERNAKLEAQLTTANSKIEWLECRA